MDPTLRKLPRRILLSGGSGFVGTHLRLALAQRWPAVEQVHLCLDPISKSSARADLADGPAVEAIVAAVKPDVVIHLAAQASVAQSTRDEKLTWAVNLGGTLNLALAVSSKAPDALFLFASTAEVYGASFLRGVVDETTPLLPMNTYARSKAHAECVLSDVLGPKAQLIIARPFNHTGPGQRDDFVLPSFVAQAARIATGRQEPRLAVGNIEVSRDFLDVRDVVDAYIDLIAASPRLPARFTCNISSDTSRPLREHIEILRDAAACDFEIAIEQDRLRPVDIPIAAGSSKLLRAVTDWAPRYAIDETLREMLRSAMLRAG